MSDDSPDGPPRDVSPADAPEESRAGDTSGESRAGDTSGKSEAGDGVPGAYTTDVRTLDPRVRWLWIVRGLVVAAVLGGATVGITLAVAPGLAWIGAGLGVVFAVLGAGHAVLLYRSWEYRVREDSMYLHRGVLTRVRTVVPYVRVQHIDTSRGPVERAVGLSSLVVYTAGSRGADVTVPGLTPEEASDLQTRLKALAIDSAGEDAV